MSSAQVTSAARSAPHPSMPGYRAGGGGQRARQPCVTQGPAFPTLVHPPGPFSAAEVAPSGLLQHEPGSAGFPGTLQVRCLCRDFSPHISQPQTLPLLLLAMSPVLPQILTLGLRM